MCALFMAERHFDDPTLPPPGQRTGAGSASILPYLLKTLAARPQGPVLDEPHAGELSRHEAPAHLPRPQHGE